MIYSEIAGYVMIFYHFSYTTTRSYNVTIRRFALLVSILILGVHFANNHEHSSWRLLMPLGMFCFAQKVLECYRRGSLLCIMLCYEINVQ